MTKRLPVAVFMWVMQPMIASATSCGSTTRFSGTAWARFSSAARSRPGTKSVATEAGDTHRKRISGPNTRASDIVMVSSAAFAAQFEPAALVGDVGHEQVLRVVGLGAAGGAIAGGAISNSVGGAVVGGLLGAVAGVQWREGRVSRATAG